MSQPDQDQQQQPPPEGSSLAMQPPPGMPYMAQPGMQPPPGMTYPGMQPQPGVAQPDMAQPGMAQPGMAQPGMAQPGMAQPGMAQPGMAYPGQPGDPYAQQPGMAYPVQPGMQPVAGMAAGQPFMQPQPGMVAGQPGMQPQPGMGYPAAGMAYAGQPVQYGMPPGQHPNYQAPPPPDRAKVYEGTDDKMNADPLNQAPADDQQPIELLQELPGGDAEQDDFAEEERRRQKEELDKKNKIFCCVFISILCCIAIIVVIIVVVTSCKSREVRDKINKLNGYISNDMKRVVITPRPDLEARALWSTVSYADEPAIQWSACEYDNYWNEEGQVVISQDAEKKMLEASYQLHNMALEAVDKVVNDDKLLTLFNINRNLWPAVRHSWAQKHTDMQGRFDFVFYGDDQPKMLEYNADTPSLIIESGKFSEDWFTQHGKKLSRDEHHQSNYIYDSLRSSIIKLTNECTKPAFMYLQEDDENVSQMRYLRSFYETYEKGSYYEPIPNLRLSFSDTCEPTWAMWAANMGFDCLFNVYPKEWLINEITQDGMLRFDFEKLRSIEPFWKLIVGNKALLPLLWSMYPNHPNLLPAYFDDPQSELGADFDTNMKWVSKPLFGREGLGVMLSKNFSNYAEFVRTTESNFGFDKSTGEKLGKSIYQEYAELPSAQNRTIQASSWIIDGMPAGLAFREVKQGENFGDTAPFLLHTVKKTLGIGNYNFKLTQNQENIRKALYQKTQDYDPNDIYKKNNIGIQKTIASPFYSGSGGKMSSLDYTDWKAYKELNLKNEVSMATIANTDTSLLPASKYWQLSDTVQSELRSIQCCKERNLQCTGGRRQLSETNLVYLKFLAQKENVSYATQKRSVKFGSIARSTFQVNPQTGGANWYSVDRSGTVRVHYWYTMGYARSWGRS